MPDANPLKHLSTTWSAHLFKFPAGPLASLEFDAVIIGSGYGGAVAALRLAKIGWHVTLLERGSEYRPGDFPNDLGTLPKHVRLPTPDGRAVMGRATGLYELRAGVNMVSMVANGVGGGSLVNAGVLVEPDDDVFAQAAWPAAIREAGTGLDCHFSRARLELGAHSAEPMTTLPKARALAELGSKLDPPRHALPVQFTIDPRRCERCGDCASGCNVKGAKLTLRDTYLCKAVAAGAQIFNSATVYKLSQRVCSQAIGGWTLRTLPTERIGNYRTLEEAALPEADGGVGIDIHARLVIIAAGTFGSTELLQRSRHLGGENFWVSSALGSRLSANGDSLNFCANLPRNVNAMGAGADGWSQLQAHPTAESIGVDWRVGPTITSQLDLRTRLANPVGCNAANAAKWRPPMQQRLLVQEGAIPGAIGRIFAELLATAYAGTQLGRWAWNPPRDASVDPLSAGHWLRGPIGDSEARRRNEASLTQCTLTLLTMGHDDSAGRIVWAVERNSSVPYWVDPAALDTYVYQERVLDAACTAIGGVFTPNPLWRLLPSSATKLMSGPKPAPAITSVHPLGGCVMGDDPCTSVVDHLGRVWRMEEESLGQKDRGERFHKDLYVLDGSIVPTSLGCNPLLTITMLAERALADAPLTCLLESLGTFSPLANASAISGSPPNPTYPPTEPKAPVRPQPPALPVELGERLVCTNLQLVGSLGEGRAHADIELQFVPMPDGADGSPTDWLSMWDDPRHRMRVTGQLRIETVGNPSWRTWTVQPKTSTVELLVAGRQPRPWRWIDGAPQWLRGVLHFLAAVWRYIALFQAHRFHLPRAVLTYLVNHRIIPTRAPPERSRVGLFAKLTELLKLLAPGLRSLMHTCEVRTMSYDITLREPDVGPYKDPSALLHLRGHKTVDYAADWADLARWFWRSKRLILSKWMPPRDGVELPPYPQLRPSFMEQVGNLHVRLYDDAEHKRAVCKPVRFELDFKDLVGRLPLRLSGDGDLPSALAALAAYLTVFGRFALKTRMYDFRLPEYSGRSVVDNAPRHQTELRSPLDAKPIQAEAYDFAVPLGCSSNDPPDSVNPQKSITLRLWRYRRPADESPDSQVRTGCWHGQPVNKLRSVLLVHAFAQSGYSFTLKSVQKNLAEALYHDGHFEVWILEHRISTRLRAHTEQSTVDQIALYDIPAAVEYILAKRACELGVDAKTLQLQVFAQCIGGAATAMSLLRGRLSHAAEAEQHPASGLPASKLPKLSGLFISQTHPFCVAAPLTQARTWIPSLLRDALKMQMVPFAVREASPTALLAAADRLFAALPVPEDELCPPRRRRSHAHDGDYDEDDCATCRRLRFIEAPLFKHANLNYETHRELPLLFGAANIRLFAHAAKCVDAERLVTEDGDARYVHDQAVHQHLNLPICFLHGADNELFDKESATRSAEQYARIHPRWADCVADALNKPEDKNKDKNEKAERASWIVSGYGHVDVLIAKDAHKRVFPKIIECMRAWHAFNDPATQVETPQQHAAARVPLNGPFIGSLRRAADGKHVFLGLSFRIDDRFSDAKFGPRAAPGTRTWAFASVEVQGGSGIKQVFALRIKATPVRSPVTGYIERPRLSSARMAHGELQVDLGPGCEAADLAVKCFSVHEAIVASRVTPANDVLPLHDALMQSVPPTGAVLDSALDMWLCALLRARDQRLQKLAQDDRPHRQTVSFLRLKPESFKRRVSAQVSKASIEALAPTPGREKASAAFAVGGCRYPGFRLEVTRVDAWLEPFQTLCKDDPVAFGLLLGDQIYADATAGFADELSPVERYLVRHRFAFTRRRTTQSPPNAFGDWLASLPVVMTPDDHEFLDGYPDGRPLNLVRPQQLPTTQQPARWAALDALGAYQTLQSRALRKKRGVLQFDAGPVRVLVLDTRSNRKPSSRGVGPNSILSTVQLTALQEWLNDPQALDRLNVIATGSVVLPGLRLETDPGSPGQVDTLQANPQDRNALLAQLAVAYRRNPDKFRVVLVSGDYHLATAAHLRAGKKPFGACIITPPLYSPMPFLNLDAHQLWFDEPLGQDLSITPLVDAQGSSVWRGNGMGRLRVDRAGGGPDALYTITYDAELRALDRYQSSDTEYFQVSLTL